LAIGASNVSAPRFRAFVSYSHTDQAFAARLQKRLETYRLPPRIPEVAESFDAAPPGRIGPIFRDREDLPAAQDLSTAVKEALAVSRALIVLCSPEAARSRWVTREIELFRELHVERPVLAVLVRGDPAEAFPAALTAGGAEPLAADLRPGGDGNRLAFLKIVAGIAGVPLDALVERDAHRKMRRVMVITVAALIMVLVMGAMTTLALEARNDARRERAEAEGLIEYMLTDLRQTLRGVGRLDIMTAVNARAMAYYTAQGDLSGLSDDSLERRARVIGAMGEDAENGGNLDLADARYRALYQTTATLLAKNPSLDERIFAHAKSENRLALLALTRDRQAEAVRRFSRTRDMLASIAAWGAVRPDWLRFAAYANGNLCAAKLKQGLGGANVVRECRRAVSLNERLLELRPGDDSAAYDLVFHLLWLADAQLASGNHAAAARTQARYLEVSEDLVGRDPENMLWREQQMEVYVRHATLLRMARRTNEARRYLDEANRIIGELTARDPANANWSNYSRRIARMLEGD
jgi:hypothetical protein